jgi:hypothetical protein
MKFYILILSSFLLSYSNLLGQDKVIETIRFNFANDSIPTKILLVRDSTTEVGEFSKIIIQGKHSYSSKNYNNWISLDNENTDVSKDVYRFLTEKNLVKSNRVFLIPINKDTLMFTFGMGYGGDASKVIIFRINGYEFKQVFDLNFWLLEISSRIEGHHLEIIGQQCFSQLFGQSERYRTYAPFQVYSLSDKFKLNEVLTKDYNLKHYYGYVGHDCSEDYVIVKIDGKDVIMKLSEAKKKFKD